MTAFQKRPNSIQAESCTLIFAPQHARLPFQAHLVVAVIEKQAG